MKADPCDREVLGSGRAGEEGTEEPTGTEGTLSWVSLGPDKEKKNQFTVSYSCIVNLFKSPNIVFKRYLVLSDSHHTSVALKLW